MFSRHKAIHITSPRPHIITFLRPLHIIFKAFVRNLFRNCIQNRILTGIPTTSQLTALRINFSIKPCSKLPNIKAYRASVLIFLDFHLVRLLAYLPKGIHIPHIVCQMIYISAPYYRIAQLSQAIVKILLHAVIQRIHKHRPI